MKEIDKLEGRELNAAVAERVMGAAVRTCKKCGSHNRMTLKSGYTQCLDCHKARNRAYQKTHRRSYPYNKTPAFKLYSLRWQLKKRYGLTLEDYNRMLAEQGNVCAICQLPPKPERRLTVDHCHKTTIVRGLLCDACNVGIEKFKENPETMGRAIAYCRRAALKAVQGVKGE